MSATLATGLKCLRCGRTSRFERHARTCAECPTDGDDPAILDVQYDYDEAAARIAAGARKRGVFRYAPLLPVAEPSRSIPRAGNTALISAPRIASRLGIRELLLKDETSNPTRCLKDRGRVRRAILRECRQRSNLARGLLRARGVAVQGVRA